jgi:hypothetical protein
VALNEDTLATAASQQQLIELTVDASFQFLGNLPDIAGS